MAILKTIADALMKNSTAGATQSLQLFSGLIDYSKWNKTKLLESYEKNEWVFSAVKVRAEALASVDFYLFRRNKDGDKEVITQPTAALTLLQKPNGFMTDYDLLEISSMHLDLVGEAFWLLVREQSGSNTGKILEIWPLDPAAMSVVKDPEKFISKYKYKVGGQVKEFSPENIVHFRENSPINMYGGTSPIMAASRSFDLDYEASKFNWNYFKNGASSRLLLILKQALEPTVFAKFVKTFRSQYTGTDNAGKPMILDREAAVHDLQKSQSEMQFAELAGISRDKLLGVYRVSKAILGLIDDVNRASMEGAQYGFQEFANKPRIIRFTKKLNVDFLNQFNDTKSGVYFGYDDPSPQNKELEIKKRESNFKIGAVTPNELRDEDGRSPVEGGDETYLPFNNTPISELAKPAAEIKGVSAPLKKKAIIKGLDQGALKKAYLRRFDQNEKGLKKKVVAEFERQEENVLRMIDQNYAKSTKAVNTPEDVLLDQNATAEEMYSALLALIIAIGIAEAQSAFSELGFNPSEFVITTSFKDALDNQTQRFTKQVTEFTYKRLKQSLALSIENGESIEQMKAGVKTIFTSSKKFRSVAIARTETLVASNTAFEKAYEQLGINKRQWLAAEDSRTRPSHSAANGQKRDRNEKFNVGASKMERPGDSNAPAEEVINCRCRLIPVVES